MIVTNYEKRHRYQMDVKKEFDHIDWNRIDLLSDHESSFVHTLLFDSKVLAVVGITKYWGGVAEVWSVISPIARNYPITFHRTCLDLINVYINQLSLHRLQMTVKAGFQEAEKWASHLGFKKEGLMQKYDCKKNDHWIYGRVI